VKPDIPPLLVTEPTMACAELNSPAAYLVPPLPDGLAT
jgi:hypothetical protein